mgnify:CR=1 FL=1
MSYKVDFDSLDSLYNAVGNQANNWISELEAVKGKLQILLDTSDMSGAAADSIKSYIENVHITLIALLTQLVSLHSSNCLLYKSDYQTKVDTGLHSVIKSTELSDFKGRIDTTKATAISIDESISYVLNGIKDIFYISYADVSKVDTQHLSVSNFLSDLDTEINTLENTHYDNDFVNTTRLINALRAFINEQTATSRTYKTNFKIEYLASSSSFLQLYDSHVDVTEEIESKSSAINAAIENENQRVADLQKEYEERQEKATIIKWIVTGVCIVGSIAAIAATGGAATPLVVGTVSAISGAVMAGTNNLTDQYVQHGNLIENSDKIDWGSVGKAAVVAGVVGFVTGAIGAGVGGAITSKLGSTTIGNTLLHSSSGFVRVGTGAVIGSASEVTSGIVTRGVGTFIATGGDLEKAFKDAVDVKNIAFDAAIGGVGGGINQYASTKQAQRAVDDYASSYNRKHNPLKDGQEYGLENLKQTANGGVDFSDSDYILRTKSGDPIQVKIKSTGDRSKDYRLAEQILKEEYGIDIDFKSMRTGSDKTHVWHHLDDYNVATNETTMQFIDINAHKAIKNHAGSAKQYHIANGTGYGKDSFDTNYGFDLTDEMSTIKEGVVDNMNNISNTPTMDSNYLTGFELGAFELEKLKARFDNIVNINAVKLGG